VISGTPAAEGTVSFTVKAENEAGSDTKELSIAVNEPVANQDDADIAAAKAAVESAVYAAAQAEVTTIAQARTRVQSIISDLTPNDITSVINDGTFTAAVPWTTGNLSGTDGSYSFTVTLTKGAGEPQTTNTLYLTITATPYSAESLADVINSSYTGLTAVASGSTVTVTGEYTGTWPIALGATPEMGIVWGAVYDGGYPVAVSGGGTITVGEGASIVNSAGGSALISSGDVIIDGGTVMANGDGATAVQAAGGVTVNGGAVVAEGTDGTAIDAGGDIALYGGVVLSRGENGIAAVSAGDIVLDGNGVVISKTPLFADDIITAEGLLIEGDTGTVYGGVTLSGQGEFDKNISVPAGTTLTIPSGSSLTVAGGTTLTNNGEIVVGIGGTLTNGGVIENNGGTVTVTGVFVGTPPVANPTPVFTAGHSEILNGSVNVTFVINWNLSALKSLTINGRVIIMTPSSGSVKRILSGYPGYSGDIGEAVSGSTEITLYSSFISHIAERADETGRQTMSANFGEGRDVSTAFTTQTSSGNTPQDDGRPSGGGGCAAGAGIAGLFALALAAWRRKAA
jgi:hypothetical protein